MIKENKKKSVNYSLLPGDFLFILPLDEGSPDL